MNNKIFILIIICLIPLTALAKRAVPTKSIVQSVTIAFNGEKIKGFYCLIDARSDEEKNLNLKNQKLNGSVIAFIQGHAQRPDDAYAFSSQLALQSKSGIVIVPVCDTPYGKDATLRGDNGKDVILYAMIKYALMYLNVGIDSSEIKDVLITINGNDLAKLHQDNYISSSLTVIGWSHGALIARRLASKYSAIKNLVQICPAGFSDWPNTSCLGTCCIVSAFSWEGMRISTEIFKGHAREVFKASFGITKGLFGDSYRSCGSCLYGNVTVCKAFRAYKDINDATIFGTDDNFPIKKLSAIVVIFGKDDSLFKYEKIVRYNTTESPKHVEQFWTRFYPEAVANNIRLNMFILPGKHIAPAIYSQEYAFYALHYTDELKQ